MGRAAEYRCARALLLLCLAAVIAAKPNVKVGRSMDWCLKTSSHVRYALNPKGQCILCDPNFWNPAPSNKYPCRCFKDGQCPDQLQKAPLRINTDVEGEYRRCECAPGWYGSPKGFPNNYTKLNIGQRAKINRYKLGCRMCPFPNRGVEVPQTCTLQQECYDPDVVDEWKCKGKVVPKLIPVPCGNTSIFLAQNQGISTTLSLSPEVEGIINTSDPEDTPDSPPDPSPASNPEDPPASPRPPKSGGPGITTTGTTGTAGTTGTTGTPGTTGTTTGTTGTGGTGTPSGTGACDSKDDIGELFGPGADANCKDLPQSVLDTSHWCDEEKWPPLQTAPSDECRKIARQTVFDGPVEVHKGYCAIKLRGRPNAALVAVSQKFIKQGKYPWGKDPVCGKCLCFKPLKPDWPKSDARWKDENLMKIVNDRKGTPLKGFVGDLCGECDDYHIDILMDVPYSTAPDTKANPAAEKVNAEYPESEYPRFIPADKAYYVGVWDVEWDWIDCDKSCDGF